MIVRVSLIVACVMAVVSIYLTHFRLAPYITGLNQDLQVTRQELAEAQNREAKVRKELQDTQDLANQLQQELQQTKDQLTETQKVAQQQRARADRAEEELNKTRKTLTDTEHELAAWRSLGIPVGTVRARLVELQEAQKTIAALQDENRLLLQRVAELRKRIMAYEGEQEPKVELPEGLKGKVIAVDPKWQFVVLDIGRRQGALPGGELLVARDGRLVAKVRIVRVAEDQSVANVLPEWKQAEVKVGDYVLY